MPRAMKHAPLLVALALASVGGGVASARIIGHHPRARTTARVTSQHHSAKVTARAADRRHSGAVNVLYAASLQNVIDARIAPAFKRATGYTLEGFPAGSSELASEIKAGTRRGDVFISAAPSVNATLTGSKNGGWVSWYAPFATTRLVLGYNPHGDFARALRAKPWYEVVDRSGFRLGFTDPMLDPKGVLAVRALRRAARLHHDPALAKLASDQDDMFPEQSLIGDLQSGQLDAGFFYTVEANAAKIPTVTLGRIDETATYTITELDRAPHPSAAAAFVTFLLSRRGSRMLASAGLEHAVPNVVGRRAAVPSALRAILGHTAHGHTAATHRA